MIRVKDRVSAALIVVIEEQEMMTAFKSMPPAPARREAALGPLKVLAEWAALLGAGLVALVRVFAGKDQTPEIISPPPEVDDLDDEAPLEVEDHVR